MSEKCLGPPAYNLTFVSGRPSTVGRTGEEEGVGALACAGSSSQLSLDFLTIRHVIYVSLCACVRHYMLV